MELNVGDLSNENWISIKKVGLPKLKLIMEHEIMSIYRTKEVLIQTEHEKMFVAFCQKVYKYKEYKEETYWYVNDGTTKVEDEVIAWMELPEKYEGE